MLALLFALSAYASGPTFVEVRPDFSQLGVVFPGFTAPAMPAVSVRGQGVRMPEGPRLRPVLPAVRPTPPVVALPRGKKPKQISNGMIR